MATTEMSVHSMTGQGGVLDGSTEEACRIEQYESLIRRMMAESADPSTDKPFEALKRVNVENNITRKTTMVIEEATDWFKKRKEGFEEMFQCWWAWTKD